MAWVIMMMNTYADALESSATAVDSTEGEDPGILSVLSERARAAARVLWNIEGGAGSLYRTPELTEAWEAHKPAKLMQRILWHLPLLELGAEAAGAGGYDLGNSTPGLVCVTAAERVVKDMRDWIRAQETEKPTKGNGSAADPVSQPEEPREPKVKQLMPTDAFEAMADALRPLAHGVRPLIAGADELSGCYIDQSSEPWKLTQQGEYLLTELADDAKKGLERLAHIDGWMLHNYMPDWCRTQLSDIREVVDRAAWMLWAGSEAANQGRDVCSDPPGSPNLTASLVYDMVKPAYRELCAKFDDYIAAQKPAIDQQYEDMGWIKQPSGEWHPTPEMLKEMGAAR